MSTVEHAIALAAQAHQGQVDWAGEPYILHPLRVMMAQTTAEGRMAAVLHDVVEDTAWTLDGLRAEGFAPAVVAAVEAVSRRDGEGYEDFVRRAAGDPIGRQVKLADLVDNSDMSRLPNATERDYQRTEKYRRAIELLRSLDPTATAADR